MQICLQCGSTVWLFQQMLGCMTGCMLLTTILDNKHMLLKVYKHWHKIQHAARNMPGVDDVVLCNVNTFVYTFTTRKVYAQTLMVLQMG